MRLQRLRLEGDLHHSQPDSGVVHDCCILTEPPGGLKHPIHVHLILVGLTRRRVVTTELFVSCQLALQPPVSPRRCDAPQPLFGQAAPADMRRGLNSRIRKTDG